MSVVSSVILQVSCAEKGFDTDVTTHFLLDEINRWLGRQGKLPLRDLTPYMPCGKHPQTFVFGGGYNYFPEEEFAEHILSLEYEYPESVVLLINPEDGATKVFRPLKDLTNKP